VVAGVAGTLYASRFLESQLFLTSRYDPVSIVAVSGILLAIAALACRVPVRRTTRVDPMRALRND
jgi:putative ABC transport system permease protein